jgi:hypothetical protein
MATAWYKSRHVPKLIKQWTNHGAETTTTTSSKIGTTLNGSHPPPQRIVQVWNTTCIVTNYGKAVWNQHHTGKNHHNNNNVTNDDFYSVDCHCLMNPANPQLSGVSQFPYFPKGGPVPPRYPTKDAHPIMGYVRGNGISWGVFVFFVFFLFERWACWSFVLMLVVSTVPFLFFLLLPIPPPTP